MPQVQSPRLRAWQARTPYALAGWFVMFMVLGSALDLIQSIQ